jgi:hypothetical protein
MSAAQPGAGVRNSVVRMTPVPNMPGAVPITMSPQMPLIPSGGTLVSSATQAGKPPPAVKPMVGPYGAPGGLDGLAGQSGHVGPGGFAGQKGAGRPGDFGAAPNATMTSASEVTDRVRVAAAYPTLKINVSRKSPWPLVALAVVVVAGATGAVWFAVNRGDTSTDSGDTSTAPARPVRKRAAPPETAPSPTAPEPGEAAKPAADPAVAPPAGSAAEPAKVAEPAVAEPAKVAEPAVAEPAKVAEPAVAPPTPPPVEAKPEPVKKKPASVGLQEPHPKAAKSKARGESKRTDPKRADVKRASKAEPKEQTWNDDSPFMPVATPKH